jgi:hypothetical protein
MKYLLTVVLCAALTSFSFSQNMDHRHTFTAQAGVNILNFINGTTTDGVIDDTDAQGTYSKLTFNSTPTFNASYDFATRKWFSVGASLGYNKGEISVENLDLTTDEGRITGSGGVTVSRTSINFRPLFHYGNSGRLDMYSGFRVGLSVWNAKIAGNLEGTNVDNLPKFIGLRGLRGAAVLPQFAMTLFGLRGYVTENFGLGFEINAGSPYLVSGGVNYRF